MNEDLFLGKSIKYWIELDKDVKTKGYEEIIEEVVQLRGKISFLKDRLNQMRDVL